MSFSTPYGLGPFGQQTTQSPLQPTLCSQPPPHPAAWLPHQFAPRPSPAMFSVPPPSYNGHNTMNHAQFSPQLSPQLQPTPPAAVQFPVRHSKKAPYFSGQSSWSDYLVQFEMVSEINQWSDNTKALELATSLRDDAVAILSELSPDDRRNYDVLVQAIGNRFEPANLTEMHRIELKSIQRKPNQSLGDLAQKVKKLVQKAYKDDPAETKTRLAKDFFVDALREPDMEWAVLQRKPCSIDEAVHYALEFESFMLSRRNRGFERRGIRMQSGLSGREECREDDENYQNAEDYDVCGNGESNDYIPFCAEHESTLGLHRQLRNRKNFERHSCDVECFFCKKKGHFRNQCQEYQNWCKVNKPDHKVNSNTSDLAAASVNRRVLGVLPPNDGLILPVDICSVPVNCLVDSGGNLSVLHPDKYYAIPENVRPPLQPSEGDIKMGNGSREKTLGVATFSLKFENGMQFSFPMVVSSLEVPGIIGYDFLYTFGALVDVRNGQMTLNGQILQCQRESRLPSLFRVTLAETVSVPPHTELMVTADIICDDSLSMCKMAVLEPTASITEKSGVCVARSLINPSLGKAPLRIVNFTDETKVLHKKTTTALGEPVLEISDGRAPEDQDLGTLPPYLEELYQRSGVNLEEDQSVELKKLLVKHNNAFAASKMDIGHTDIIRHAINTGSALPIKQPLRRMPPVKRDAVREEITRMKAQGVIEESSSPWASPVVLVKKKDGSWRFCIDYRQLNSVTIKDSYPLPRIDDSLDALRGAGKKRWFSTMDLASGYWQVAMDPESADRTAFISAEGLYQFKVLPFGLCNAPATFERLMESVLAGLHWTTCLIYLDDIIVFADSFEQHIQRLDEILTRLFHAGLKLSPKKCDFFQPSVKFLGHIISNDGISADPEKTKAISAWPQPIDVKEVKSFLGTCSYYRRFIQRFADIAKPLNNLTLKHASFVWTTECDTAFTELKQAISTAPVLSYPSDTGQYILDTDASANALGSVLSQLQGETGDEKVIAYFSKAMSKEERNYCVTRKELLAIVKSVRHFHHYLYGSKFKVRTDHGSLTWLMKFKQPEGQLARWLEVLGTYDFTIEFRAGKYHLNADGLSRIPCDVCKYCHRHECRHLTVHAISCCTMRTDAPSTQPVTESEKSLRTAQQTDADIGSILQVVEAGGARIPPEDVENKSLVFRRYWHQWDRLTVHHGVLCRKWYNKGDQVTLQSIVPAALKIEILRGLHDDKVAGHMGITKTFKRVQESYYWCGYHRDVEDWCKKCSVCQARMPPGKTPKAHLKKVHTGVRFQRTSLDILGPLPVSAQGNRYILLITDYFSKWAEAVSLQNIEAITVARAFVDNFVSRFGVPAQVHTDQGKQFEAKLFQETCKILGADKTRTTPYWPQSDGFVERLNRTLEDLLSKMIDSNQRNWDECLQLAMLAYRSSVQESTNFSPSYMLYGMEVNLPIHVMYGSVNEEADNLHEFSWCLRERLQKVHQLAREHLDLAEAAQIRQYDQKIHLHTYNEGDKVWLRQSRKFKGISPKLQMRWTGPYRVVKRISDLTYKVKSETGSKYLIVHHNRMKPYFERDNVIQMDSDAAMTSSDEEPPELSGSDSQDSEPLPRRTRRGRPIIQPTRYRDFVM